MATAERLGVWLDGIRVAELTSRRAGSIDCQYSDQALARWPQNSPVISCSLPLGPRRQPALAFCKGLLPEGNALQTLAERAGLATNDTFGLLARYGRDVAGALVIGKDDPDERRFGVEPYTPKTLEGAIDELDDRPLGSGDDSESRSPASRTSCCWSTSATASGDGLSAADLPPTSSRPTIGGTRD